MLRKIILVCLPFLIFANDGPLSLFDLDYWNYNAGVIMNFGDSYDDYTYMENRMDINFFKGNFAGWLQYEYSDPPELGFSIMDLRKYRMEYSSGPWSLKYGDMYEVWGRGLILVQLDDQSIDFDNSTRGLLVRYDLENIRVSQMNGRTKNAQLGNDLRRPEFEFTHDMDATNIEFDIYPFNVGLSFLQSNEKHQVKTYGPMDTVNVNHRLHGGYISWFGSFSDVFIEYVDKQSKLRKIETNFFGEENEVLEPLKKGSGTYINTNFYLGSWSLFFEYKRYNFDKLNPVDTDYVINNYGNRIDYQVMPILYREQNHSFLGRAAHQTNANDERGIQFELTGGLPWGFQFVSQYSHLSRNDTWQSHSPIVWEHQRVKGLLPSSSTGSLPYKENYNELNGYLLGDKLYFKIAHGRNKEIPKITRFFDGSNFSIMENWVYTDSIWFGDDWYYLDSQLVSIDTSIYNVETKLYQRASSFTIPLEINYSFDNGYSIGLGFAYQERRKRNITRGNSSGFYDYIDSTWVLYEPDDPSYNLEEATTMYPNSMPVQINRMITLSMGRASRWAMTLNCDWTDVQEIITKDPHYNPLEALVYGDMKYFSGDRDISDPPAFAQNKWISLEISYNLSSTQRISLLYGSVQGGLICSNGICRVLQPFNDGLKLSYSAIF